MSEIVNQSLQKIAKSFVIENKKEIWTIKIVD